eukprot:TRINITY_DN9676_c0_g2_i4.p1 TRINITY_DN9676_c0_g2~~TRINITY_DN9676_c0_g2_i4.p1  ORF type:complete len:399 (-),score=94.05 TRINITY_DN9676_c0_g2_i4:29-1138(-)
MAAPATAPTPAALRRAVAVAGPAGEIVLVDPADLAVVARVAAPAGREVHSVHRLRHSPLVAAGLDDGTLLVWNSTAGGAPEAVQAVPGHSATISCIATSPDGRLLATASDDSTAGVWQVGALGAGLGPEHTVRTHRFWVMSVAFNCDSTRLVTASTDGSFVLHDTSGWAVVLTHQAGDECRATAFHPRDPGLLAVGMGSGTVELFCVEGANLAAVHTLSLHENWIHSVAFDCAGTRLATGCRDGLAMVVDLASGEPVVSVEHRQIVWGAYLLAEGALGISASEDGTIMVWNSQTGQTLRTAAPAGRIYALSVPAASPWLDIGPLRELCVAALATAPTEALARLPGHIQDEIARRSTSSAERPAKRVRQE